MNTRMIDPSARIEAGAAIGQNVSIGPYCTIGPHVSVGDGCRLHAHVNLTGHTTIGARTAFLRVDSMKRGVTVAGAASLSSQVARWLPKRSTS